MKQGRGQNCFLMKSLSFLKNFHILSNSLTRKVYIVGQGDDKGKRALDYNPIAQGEFYYYLTISQGKLYL